MSTCIDISVVIPVWNTDVKLLERCIESIRCQSFGGNIEIILMFDGLGQDCFKWCKTKYAGVENVVVEEKANTGVSDTRNAAIALSRGKYVMFCDSDDTFNESICAQAYDAAERNDADMVIWNYVCIYDDNKFYNRLYRNQEWIRRNESILSLNYGNICKNFESELLPDIRMGIGGVWNRMYRAKMLKENNITFCTECAMSEDLLFNLYANMVSKCVVYINCDGYNYYFFNSSSSNKWDKNGIEKNNNFIKHLEKFRKDVLVKAYPQEDYKFRRAQSVVTVNTLIRQLGVTVFAEDNPTSIKKKRKEFLEIISQEPYCSAIKNSKIKDFTIKQKFSLIAFRLKSYSAVGLLLKLARHK